MIVTLELTAETAAVIRRHEHRAEELAAVLADGLEGAATMGAESVREDLSMGDLGLTMRHPGQGGLAGSVSGWMIDRSAPLAAIGVPANTPAAAYATIHEFGGEIRPGPGKRALAIPVSDEAKLWGGPREHAAAMGELVLVKRADGPPLLIRPGKGGSIELHWVLVPKVTIQATHWLSRGVARAKDTMISTFQGVVDAWIGEGN